MLRSSSIKMRAKQAITNYDIQHNDGHNVIRQRPTVSECFHHPWIAQHSEPPSPSPLMLKVFMNIIINTNASTIITITITIITPRIKRICFRSLLRTHLCRS